MLVVAVEGELVKLVERKVDWVLVATDEELDEVCGVTLMVVLPEWTRILGVSGISGSYCYLRVYVSSRGKVIHLAVA